MTMATIIGRKREKKEEENFYKKFSVQYMNDHERGLNDRNVRHTR